MGDKPFLTLIIGVPKFNSAYNQFRHGDAPDVLEYTIPHGMKSAYMSHLQWDSGGYADIHRVQSDGDLVFLRRINTELDYENSNHGNGNQFDGNTVLFSDLAYSILAKIRLTIKDMVEYTYRV